LRKWQGGVMTLRLNATPQALRAFEATGHAPINRASWSATRPRGLEIQIVEMPALAGSVPHPLPVGDGVEF